MPSAEEDALVAAKAARTPDGDWDWEVYKTVYQRGLAERQARLQHDARACYSAMDGWAGVKSEADWQAKIEQADEHLATGRFLLDQMGAERYLEPHLMAALIVLRRRIITELRIDGGADLMLLDMALIAYYHQLRLNGWIGNFASLLEADAFGLEGPKAKLRGKYGAQVDGLKVEDIIARIGEQLLPLMDRCNRLMLRNLRALRDPRQRPAASVTIGAAGQVNVGAQQVNVAEDGRLASIDGGE
jgi:hypothetical protein